MKSRILLVIINLLVASQVIFCQNMPWGNGQFSSPGIITGEIIDSTLQAPVEYATVSILKNDDQKAITGAVSDSTGKFLIDKIPYGNFKAVINFIGYTSLVIDSIQVTPDHSNISLGTIKLTQKAIQLDNVEVTAEKGAVEFAIDKMVINVEKTLPAAGGSVIDVLKNTPSVNFDMDNNISLRGNSNITILLDGRPSGAADPAMLAQMPASAIDKIEIVTNPSAKYDADGTAGIINLIMKQQKEANWNGMIQANAGTRDRYGSSINLNYKKDNWNIFGNYDNRFNTWGMNGSIDRYTILSSGNINAHQDMANRYKGFSQNLRVGADYSLDEQNSLNSTLLYNNGNGSSNNLSQNINEGNTNSENSINYSGLNKSKSHGRTLDYTLTYKRKFTKPGQELTSDFYFSRSTNDDDLNRELDYSNSSENTPNAPDLQNTFSYNSNGLLSIKVDYISPVGETGKFESGVKSIFRRRSIDYNVNNYDYSRADWITDLNQSNDFAYNEQIHAAYAMYSDNIIKFKYQLGLRIENALTRSEQKTLYNKYTKDYFSIIPTIHLSQELAEGQEIKLSYSRRLNRPPVQMINPFIRYMDPLNAWAGNPYLKPEYTDSYEFGHNLITSIGSLFSNVFFRKIHDNINQHTELKDNNITVSTFRNIAGVTSYGIEFNGFTQVFKWWSLNSGYSYYGTKFDPNTPQLSNTNTSKIWTARVSSTINTGLDMDFQFNCFYMSGNVTPQGKSKGMFFSDIGLKKTLMERKLAISLSISDVFDVMRFRNETFGTNFYSTVNFKPYSRVFTLTIQYNLNNYSPLNDRRNTEDNGSREYENTGQQR